MVKSKNKKKNSVNTYTLINKIEKLELKKEELEKSLSDNKKERRRAFHCKNLKISKHTINFLIPFAVSSGISLGVVAGVGFGLPFKKDNVSKVKRRDFSYCSDEGCKSNDYYERLVLGGNVLPKNSLTVYTPWEEKDNGYTRFKRVYSLDEFNYEKLKDAIMENNFEYIDTFFDSYDEEIQTVNKKVFNDEDNDYYFDAELHCRDNDDILKEPESDTRNFLVSFFVLLFGFGVGGAVAKSRSFKYKVSIKKEIDKYRKIIGRCDLEEIMDKINETESELNTLRKKLVKSNENK